MPKKAGQSIEVKTMYSGARVLSFVNEQGLGLGRTELHKRHVADKKVLCLYVYQQRHRVTAQLFSNRYTMRSMCNNRCVCTKRWKHLRAKRAHLHAIPAPKLAKAGKPGPASLPSTTCKLKLRWQAQAKPLPQPKCCPEKARPKCPPAPSLAALSADS